jgi:hypothetical protein
MAFFSAPGWTGCRLPIGICGNSSSAGATRMSAFESVRLIEAREATDEVADRQLVMIMAFPGSRRADPSWDPGSQPSPRTRLDRYHEMGRPADGPARPS